MVETVLVASPTCQLTRRALLALEQASADEILRAGAFAEMGHLAAEDVLRDGLEYAAKLLGGPGAEAEDAGMLAGLPGRGLLVADALFLSQLLGLRDVAAAHGIHGRRGEDGEESSPLTLADLILVARDRLVARADSWRAEPGRPSPRLRVQKGENDILWPVAVLTGEAGAVCPDAEADPDAFALFAALPLMAPFLALEEDCYVAPRLE